MNFGILFDIPEELHNIKLDEECLEIGSISDNSPFHKITLNHINAIVDLEENIAIVLNNSIIFLSKISKEISIDIRQYTPTLIDKISHLLGF